MSAQLLTAAARVAAALPADPKGPKAPSVNIDLSGVTSQPSNSVVFFLLLGALSVLPALLLMCTSFTKIVVVLGLTRNALGLQGIPPNQVLVGLALFLSLFIMAPTLSQANKDGVQPYLNGKLTTSQAFDAGMKPMRKFMVKQTGTDELELLTKVAKRKEPKNPESVPTSTLVPAFMISELKQAFIIGFVIFIPFLVIDVVVSSALMALGMMMMPPVMVSLPFKLLLFVMVDGWGLIITNLVASYK